MSRRRAVVLYSAFALLGLGSLVAVALVATLHTQFGRDRVRGILEDRLLAPRVKGNVHVWGLASLSFGGATIDSLEIKGLDDSVFVRLRRVDIEFNPLDLWDKRTLLTRLEIERAFVHLRKDSTGTWNWKRIFPPDSGPKRPRGPDRGWGDYIVADTVVLRDATFLLTMPWHPSDTLRGAKRDSAIAYNLRRDDREVRRAGSGFARTWRWTNIDLVSGYVRLSDPDSTGRLFHLARLDADEADPPFAFRDVRGSVRQLGDSIWLELKHFDLPGSTGSATGKVVWGSNLPTRYDLRIVGDSVSLADVAWVYPTLPRTGGGSMVLNIRNEPQDLSVIDYAISKMDVRTTRSRLRGNMTFGVGAPVLIVKDVALEADPVNFDLIRALNGGPFPYDWQGDLIGTVRGRGGPVNRFRVDDADIVFRDANVPGAVTRASARGELDILYPAFTTFRGFNVDVAQLDLRTLQFLNPSFPRVNGIVSGRAALDSVWVDVRFRNADLTHRDGDDPPTRATGSGRVTLGETFVAYDLALTAQPLSFTTLARSYPALPLRGPYEGPLRINGTIDDLTVTTELTGPAGTFSYDGRIDGYPRQYSARGTLGFSALDIRTLLANDTLPATSLTGRARLDVAVDSAARDSALASLAGSVTVDLDRSTVDSLRIYPSHARVAFNGGRARLDTLRLETVAANVIASGALGLTRAVSDSIRFLVRVDSLGGIRRYIGVREPVVADNGANGAPADSLGGSVTLAGVASGNIDSLSVAGSLGARDLWVRGDRAKIATGSFSFSDVTNALAGELAIRADTATLAGISIAMASLSARARDRWNVDVAVNAISATGPQLLATGSGTLMGDTTFVRIDTLGLRVRDHHLSLERPTRVVIRPDGVVLDSLRLRDARSGWLSVVGTIPTTLPVALSIRADSLELGDIGELVQAKVPFGGVASMDLRIEGTRTDPRMVMTGALAAPRFGEVRLDRATLSGRYAARRLETMIDLFRGERSALSITASIPADLALASVPRRMLPEPLTGKIRSDSVELAIVEAFTTSVRNATGKFTANLDIGGRWDRPALIGNVLIVDGALQLTPLGAVRLFDLNADLAFSGDSITIRRFSVLTREERTGNLALSGAVNVADWERPRFDLVLGARDFHIIERARVAHLDVSANLRLTGSYDSSTLTGAVTVDRGSVFIPELVTKQVISLDDPELYNVVDTTLTMNRSLLPTPPPELVRNLSVENVEVRMGDDVWLRSDEANINLGGTVHVTVPRNAQGSEREQLGLEGELTTNRGTYRLNLGIVQRTFQVETGSIRFLGDADGNGLLNINALYRVPRLSIATTAEQDIRVRVKIRGTLAQPRLDLESADSLLNISRTDLVSYLITGAPNFDIGAQGSLATSLLSSVGSLVGDWLRSAAGVFDIVQFQFGRQGVGSGGAGRNSIFSGASLLIGRQLDDKTFVSASAGLCQVWSALGGGAGSGATSNLYDLLGVKVEHRVNQNLGVSGSYEPGTSAQFCDAGGAGARGFTFTPRQLGFDIFRTWRF